MRMTDADSWRRMSVMEIETASSRQLLQTYARILTELVDRGVTRSRNAPLGDVAEFIVAAAYSGTLAPPSEKTWDVCAADGRKIQVKSRLVVPNKKGTQQYSPFRSWDFDACVFVNFDAYTYDVLEGLEVPAEGVRALAAPVPHVGATAARVHTKMAFTNVPGTVDVTERLRQALDALG